MCTSKNSAAQKRPTVPCFFFGILVAVYWSFRLLHVPEPQLSLKRTHAYAKDISSVRLAREKASGHKNGISAEKHVVSNPVGMSSILASYVESGNYKLEKCWTRHLLREFLKADPSFVANVSLKLQDRSMNHINDNLIQTVLKFVAFNASQRGVNPFQLGMRTQALQAVLHENVLSWPPTPLARLCWPFIAPVLRSVQKVLLKKIQPRKGQLPAFVPMVQNADSAFLSMPQQYKTQVSTPLPTPMPDRTLQEEECFAYSCVAFSGVNMFCNGSSSAQGRMHLPLKLDESRQYCYTPPLWPEDVPIPIIRTRHANARGLQFNRTLGSCCAQLRDIEADTLKRMQTLHTHGPGADAARVERLKRKRVESFTIEAHTERRIAGDLWLADERQQPRRGGEGTHFYTMGAAVLIDSDYAHGPFASVILDDHTVASHSVRGAEFNWQSYQNFAAKHKSLQQVDLALHVGNTNAGDSSSFLDLLENFIAPFWANFHMVQNIVGLNGVVLLPFETGQNSGVGTAGDAFEILNAMLQKPTTCAAGSTRGMCVSLGAFESAQWWVQRPVFVDELRILEADQNKHQQWQIARQIIRDHLSQEPIDAVACSVEAHFNGNNASMPTGKFGRVQLQTHNQWTASFTTKCHNPGVLSDKTRPLSVVVLVSDRTHRLGNLASCLQVLSDSLAGVRGVPFTTSVQIVHTPTRADRTEWRALFRALHSATLILTDAHELPALSYLVAPAGTRILQMSTQASARMHYYQHDRMFTYGMAAGMRVRTYAGTALKAPVADGQNTVEIHLADLASLRKELHIALLEIAREWDCSGSGKATICSDRS